MGVKKQDIYDLIDRFEEGSVSRLRVSWDGMELELEKAQAPLAAVPAQVAPAVAEAAPVASAPDAAPAGPSDDGAYITAPLVGTFYTSPAPGEPPFVQVGDEVAANQTLCIVEAMKLMNEITAEEMGTVREVCLEDAMPVEFGTPLFYVEPHGAPAPAPETA